VCALHDLRGEALAAEVRLRRAVLRAGYGSRTAGAALDAAAVAKYWSWPEVRCLAEVMK
jgi:adenine deaminase